MDEDDKPDATASLAALLWDALKKDPEHKDRRQTAWGTKTKIGLRRSVEGALAGWPEKKEPCMTAEEKLKKLQDAVRAAVIHIVDYGAIKLGTPQSKALNAALAESEKAEVSPR